MKENRISVYQGHRDEKGVHVLVNRHLLRHVPLHSPTGFGWGYGGSGPADLALSILAHHFKETYLTTAYLHKWGSQKSKAWQYHQRFKWDFVATWNKDYWIIDSEDITEWLRKQHQPTVNAIAA